MLVNVKVANAAKNVQHGDHDRTAAAAALLPAVVLVAEVSF
jgi:hypothetical protein